MARVHPFLDSFNAGEFGPRMSARVSFAKYQNAGAQCQNIAPLPQGGWTRVPGTRYIAGVADSTKRHRLIPFEFSTTQAYILEFGDQTIRFYRNQGQITAADTDAAITNGTFDSNITGWTDQSNGTGAIAHDSTNNDMDLAGAGSGNEAIAEQSVSTTNTGQAHVICFKVVGDPGDEITVRVGSSSGASDYQDDARKQAGWHTISFTPTASPFYLQFENGQDKTISIDDVAVIDDAAVEIASPWAAADLSALLYAQSADVLYVCGDATRPYRLERYGHAAWSLEKVLFEDGPYLDANTTSTTLTPGANTGNGVTITASSTTGINGGDGFKTSDVGRLIRFKDDANAWSWMQIVGHTNATTVTVDIKGPDLNNLNSTTGWRLGEWSDDRGWPRAVGFIQQRLGFANITEDPQKFWLSKSADIENFADEDTSGDTLADSAIGYRFAAIKVNAIQWLAMRKKPVIGTVGGPWTLRSDGAVLTPTDIAADFETSAGTAAIAPIEARNRLLYVQRAKRKLMEFADVLSESGVQGFDSFDLTLLNERVLEGGVSEVAYAEEPDSQIWCVRDDGQVAVLTYQPDQQVIGWARRIVGGSFEGGDAVVESVAAIPGNNGSGQFKDSTGRDEVWFIVKREIDGATTRYVECVEKVYNGDEDLQEEAFYVDSGLTLDDPVAISDITQADPGVVTTSSAHGFSDGDTVRIVRVKGMTEVNGGLFTVANKTATTFELTDMDGNDVDTSGYTAYSAGGEVRKRVSSVSGLDHLEGETVRVLADGAVQTDKTVSSGAVTLDSPAGMVHVGLSYEHRWKSLKLAYGAQGGSAVGKSKNAQDIVVSIMETGEGALEAALETEDGEGAFTALDLRQATDLDRDPVPYKTGEVSLGLESQFDLDPRVVLKGSSPTPCTVLGFGPEMQTNEQI